MACREQTADALPPRHPRRAAHTDDHERSEPPASDDRSEYTTEAQARYDRLSNAVEGVLADQDINPQTDSPDALAAAIAAWLVAAQQSEAVRPTALSADEWIDRSVRSAYEKGVADARDQLREAGVALDRSTPQARLNQPGHQARLNQLRAGQREAWQRLAGDLEDEVAAAVRQTARAGGSTREIVRAVQDRIEKTGTHRAGLIGETEPARAYHEAQLSEYELTGVSAVELSWQTMGDLKVCLACRAGAAQSPYSLEEARGALPHHPRCRCWWVPDSNSMRGPRR